MPTFGQIKGRFDVSIYGAVGNGSVNDYAAISNAAADATLQKGGELYFPPGIYYINTNLTLSGNYALTFAYGAMLRPAPGIVISIGVDINAFGFQIFDPSYGGFIRWSKTATLNVKWFGAKGDGVSLNDDIGIQAAIDAFKSDNGGIGRGAIYIPSGQYNTGKTITINTDKVKVRIFGDGWTQSFINHTGIVENGAVHVLGDTYLDSVTFPQPTLFENNSTWAEIYDLAIGSHNDHSLYVQNSIWTRLQRLWLGIAGTSSSFLRLERAGVLEGSHITMGTSNKGSSDLTSDPYMFYAADPIVGGVQLAVHAIHGTHCNELHFDHIQSHGVTTDHVVLYETIDEYGAFFGCTFNDCQMKSGDTTNKSSFYFDGCEATLINCYTEEQSLNTSHCTVAGTLVGGTAHLIGNASSTGKLTLDITGRGNVKMSVVDGDFWNVEKIGTLDTWSAAITYSAGDFATYNAVDYRSLQSTNLNQQPDIFPTYWIADDAPYFISMQNVKLQNLPSTLLIHGSDVRLKTSNLNIAPDFYVSDGFTSAVAKFPYYADNSSGGTLIFYKTRGTAENITPVQADDNLGEFDTAAYVNSTIGYQRTSRFRTFALTNDGSRVNSSFEIDLRDEAGNEFDAMVISQSGLRWNTGAIIKQHLSGTAAWQPVVADGNAASTTVTVSGAVIGDTVAVGFSEAIVPSGLISGAVTSADTVTVSFFNKSGSQWSPAGGTLRADVWKH